MIRQPTDFLLTRQYWNNIVSHLSTGSFPICLDMPSSGFTMEMLACLVQSPDPPVQLAGYCPGLQSINLTMHAYWFPNRRLTRPPVAFGLSDCIGTEFNQLACRVHCPLIYLDLETLGLPDRRLAGFVLCMGRQDSLTVALQPSAIRVVWRIITKIGVCTNRLSSSISLPSMKWWAPLPTLSHTSSRPPCPCTAQSKSVCRHHFVAYALCIH